MRIRHWKLRHWFGHLTVIALLFTQSSLIWAQVAISSTQAQQSMHHACESMQTAKIASHDADCLQDCCQQHSTCASNCLSMCFTAGMNLLSAMMVGVSPFFNINSIHPILAHSPDGIHSAVLERPPRHFA